MKISIVAAAAALVLCGVPATAAPTSTPPDDPEVLDQAGDANGINEGIGNSFGISPTKGVATPVDLTAVGDVLSAWFTSTRSSVVLHIRTEEKPTPISDIYYLMWLDYNGHPGLPCTSIHVLYSTRGTGAATATCRGSSLLLGDSTTETVALKAGRFNDGTGHIEVTIPKTPRTPFASGEVLSSPVLVARGVQHTPTGARRLITYDTTEAGRDYVIP